MKTLNILILTLFFGSVLAQTQIPEGGFDNWAPNSTNVYFEPEGDWWATLNPLATLGGPVTVSPTTDAHSGEYAAQLKTEIWGTLLISGLLVSGDFILAQPYILNGKPFSDTPSKFKGWYKYSPVNSDSAGVAAILTRYNTETNQRDTLATAIKALTQGVQSYMPFEIDFDYTISGMDPDSIIIVFTSSGAGGDFAGEVGSTLIIDDIVLEYGTNLQENLLPEFRVSAFPSPAAKQINFMFNTSQPQKLLCHIYSFDGQLIRSFSPQSTEHRMDVSKWHPGKYILQVFKDNSLASTAKFIVAK